MGLFAGLFETKKINLFDEIAIEFGKEEKKKVLFKSPFLDVKTLTLNQDSIRSFVIAIFCFELDINPKFQSLRLKKEYYAIIEKEKNIESFQILYKSMHEYYKVNPVKPTSHWKITYAYLETVWSIKEKIPDPILVTVYSMYLTDVRVKIKQRFENSLSDFMEP